MPSRGTAPDAARNVRGLVIAAVAMVVVNVVYNMKEADVKERYQGMACWR